MGGTIRIGGRETDILKLVIVGVMIFVVTRAFILSPMAMEWLIVSDNDDIMRYLSVREFLDGKGWYDKTQYRLVPPDGLHLHWSRLLDAAQAGLIAGFALFLPLDTASNLAISLWPILLFFVLVLMTAATGRRAFNAWVGAIAVLFLVFWPMIAANYFRPMRLDHHNVQIILGSAVVFSTLLRGRAAVLGLGAGLAAGLSISIGLENLLVLALVGALLAVRSLIDPEPNTKQMTAYGFGALLLATALFFVETPRADWLSQTCDVLSYPVLTLLAAASLISAGYQVVAHRMSSPATRALALLVLSALILGASYPLWSPCLLGPYGHLPDEAKLVIAEQIIEGRPAYEHFFENSSLGATFFPAVGAIGTASLVFAYRLKTRGLAGGDEVRNVATLLLFGWVGVLMFAFYQSRLVVIAASAAPLLAGYAVVSLWTMRNRNLSPARSLAFVAAVAVTILGASFYQVGGAVAHSITSESDRSKKVPQHSCRKAPIIETLNSFPRGRILSPMDFGAPILLLTEHEALAAPYHRNPDAMINGIVPFEGGEAALKEAAERFSADYILLCRDVFYGKRDSFVSGVASGRGATWLEPLEGAHESLVLLAVK